MIWAIVALLAIFSFLPVYSAASNLAYSGGNGQTFGYFIKHFVHLFLGGFEVKIYERDNPSSVTTFEFTSL